MTHVHVIVTEPDLVPRAVEEVLRVEPTAVATTRMATTDVEYRGVVIPAGMFVALSKGSQRAADRAGPTPWAPSLGQVAKL